MVVLPDPGTPASAMRMRWVGSEAWRANKCCTRVRSVSTILATCHDSACPDILPGCGTFPVIAKVRTLGLLQSSRRPANLFCLSPGSRTSVAGSSTDARGPLVVSMTRGKTAGATALDGTIARGNCRADLLWGRKHGLLGPGTGNPTAEAFQEASAWVPWFAPRGLLGIARFAGGRWRGRRRSGLARATLVRHQLRNSAMIA